MDLRALLLAVVLLPHHPAAPQQAPRGHPERGALVTDSGVGALRLRMTPDEVRSVMRVVADTMLPNWDCVEPERTLLVRLGTDTVRAAVSAQGRVDRIDIYSPRFRTADGIHVGATVQSVLRPGAKGGVSEATVGFQLPSHCGLRFVVAHAPDLERAADLDYRQLRAFPQAARVSRIEIVGCGP